MCRNAIVQARENLVYRLRARTEDITDWFATKEERDLHRIIYDSVGASTARGIQGMPWSPLDAFRTWASRALTDRMCERVRGVCSRADFEDLLDTLIYSLVRFWSRYMGGDRYSLLYCHRRKLVDLLMKRLVLWTGIRQGQRQRLRQLLHVPLDSRILRGLAPCLLREELVESIGLIPPNANMNFVRNKEMYDSLQKVVRTITQEAEVPAIYLDVYVWNLGG